VAGWRKAEAGALPAAGVGMRLGHAQTAAYKYRVMIKTTGS